MTGNGLPAHCAPGEYTAAKVSSGSYGVYSPDGRLRAGFTTLGSAQTRADEWNTIRRRLASIH